MRASLLLRTIWPVDRQGEVSSPCSMGCAKPGGLNQSRETPKDFEVLQAGQSLLSPLSASDERNFFAYPHCSHSK